MSNPTQIMENILVVALLLQMATFVASINRTGTIQRDLPDCINNDDYFFFNGRGVTCLWVDMNRREYCEKHLFRIKCPKTCGAYNGKESNYYSGMKKDKSGNIHQTCQWLKNHSIMKDESYVEVWGSCVQAYAMIKIRRE